MNEKHQAFARRPTMLDRVTSLASVIPRAGLGSTDHSLWQGWVERRWTRMFALAHMLMGGNDQSLTWGTEGAIR